MANPVESQMIMEMVERVFVEEAFQLSVWLPHRVTSVVMERDRKWENCGDFCSIRRNKTPQLTESVSAHQWIRNSPFNRRRMAVLSAFPSVGLFYQQLKSTGLFLERGHGEGWSLSQHGLQEGNTLDKSQSWHTETNKRWISGIAE